MQRRTPVLGSVYGQSVSSKSPQKRSLFFIKVIISGTEFESARSAVSSYQKAGIILLTGQSKVTRRFDIYAGASLRLLKYETIRRMANASIYVVHATIT
jgi:hypothetical protein